MAGELPLPRAKQTGFKRLVSATCFALAGLRAAWRHEASFRQECALVTILTPLALWVGTTATQRALLIGSCWLILIVELLNSAVEASVDRIGLDHHPLSERAKDLGSAAVLVSLGLAAMVWGLIVTERFT